MAKLRVDLNKCSKQLEEEKDKSAEQATQLARLNKQAASFESKIHSANTRKLRAIEDLEIKNKEYRVLAQNLKEAEAAPKAEWDRWSAEQTAAKTQLTAKDEELAALKAELDASRTALETYQEAESKLRLEEDAIRAKEKELLTAITPPPPIEEPTPLAEVPSSSAVLEAPEGLSTEIPVAPLPTVASPVAAASPVAVATSSSAPLPIIELTSPGSPGKSIAEIATGKRPGRKLTRVPPSKRRLILPADKLRWIENMGLSRLMHNLYNENKKLRYENDKLRQQVTELSSAAFSAASKNQLEAQIESLQAQFKLAMDLNQKLTSKLGKLKADYESELAEKLKALQLKDDEVTSLNTSLNSAKTEVSIKEDKLKTSQTALVVYKANEDTRYKERATP
ncbi:uncharacterized protein LOC121979778 [Zingiber officinale]|uniref:uncharacterized protein LOC121979778 n=1 Tax=Zingiber officinale TaxID=94328 RepID=UPI001C4A85BF|nr:uncharacterized protein LOC121979778 [Zingiber officinale]